MSTRGALGFQMNNTIKATYNHYDSYPEGLGCEVVDFLSKLTAQDIDKLKNNIKQLRWVSEEKKPSRQDITRYVKYSNKGVNTQTLKDWYCLLRNVQGITSFALILTGLLDVLIDSSDFLKDSLFCEWAYIINFDDNTLDTYEGFQKDTDNSNILGTEFTQIYDGTRYYPCKCVFRLSLKDLTTSQAWLKRFKLATRNKREE